MVDPDTTRKGVGCKTAVGVPDTLMAEKQYGTLVKVRGGCTAHDRHTGVQERNQRPEYHRVHDGLSCIARDQGADGAGWDLGGIV